MSQLEQALPDTFVTKSLETLPNIFAQVEALAKDFATRAGAHDKEGSFPFENFTALHEAKLLSLTIPHELGGEGLGLSTICRVIEGIARGDASTALVLTMHYLQHANAARSRRWHPEVYKRLCRESIQGIALINAARVEPELGTPARGGLPATIAERTTEGWRLTATSNTLRVVPSSATLWFGRGQLKMNHKLAIFWFHAICPVCKLSKPGITWE